MVMRCLFVFAVVFLMTVCSEAQVLEKRYGGAVQTEVAANVSTAAVWAVYRSNDLPRLLVQLMPTIFRDIEYVSGDGSVGTILRLIPQPGAPGGTRLVNVTVIDDKTMTRVLRQIEGGVLDTGFTLFETRYKIIQKRNNFCLIRTTITFRVNDGSQNSASNITPNWNMPDAILNYVAQQQAR